MKLEGFLKGGIIAVTTLMCILLVFGNTYWQAHYDVDNTDIQSLNKTINTRYDNLKLVRSSYENTALLTYTESGQADEDNIDSNDNFLTYQARAFEGAGKAVKSSGGWFSLIDGVGAALWVPPIITGAVVLLIIISVAFALIAVWRGKRI